MEKRADRIDHGYDPLIMAAVMALIAIGLGVAGSAIFGNATTGRQLGHATAMIYKQFIAVGVGLIAFFVILIPRWEFLYRSEEDSRFFVNIAMLLSLIVMFGLLFFGKRAGGASRWYNLGFFSVQPGEFFKVLFVIFVAYHVGRMKRFISRSPIYAIKLFIVVAFADLLLYLLPDRGSMAQLTLLTITIVILARIRLRSLLLMILAAGLMISLAIMHSDNLMARVASWLFPEQFAKGAAYQAVMASTMIKSGGIFGAGLGKGIMGGLHWLPEQQNDYIVALLIEDLGMAGLFVIIALYLSILWRATILAMRLKSTAQRYMVFGLAMLITSQAVININVTLNLTPSKGAVLPFISYGGSSMIAFLCAVAIIEWMHRYARRVNE